MMNYAAEEAKCEQTIASNIRETVKIMHEMKCVLGDFALIINGSKNDDKTPVDVDCLSDEASVMLELACENLQKLLEIRRSLI